MTTTKKLYCCFSIKEGEKDYKYWTLSSQRKTSIEECLDGSTRTWTQLRKKYGYGCELVNITITPFK
jgi:hypothetical protein